MHMKLHSSSYDETQGLFVIHERQGHGIVKETSHMITKIVKNEFITTRYDEYDIIHDFSDLSQYDKTVMKRK
jgi:hypothetical protein